MKKLIKNRIFAHHTPHTHHTQHALLFKYTYPLIASAIIALTLSPVHTKTAYNPYFQDPAHGSAATKKLHRAAHTGNSELAREAIRECADLNAKGEMYWTALMHASDKGHTEIVQLLLECQANVSIKSPQGNTALILAMSKGHPEIVRLLLNYTEPTQASEAVKKAATRKIHRAAYTGNIELAYEAIREQADINARDGINWTALMHASEEGHTAMVHLLLEHQAQVNFKSSDGNTALIRATAKDRPEIVRLLLEHNANPDIKGNSGWTALVHAAYKDHTEIIHLLLAHHANTDIQSESGHTALHWGLSKPTIVEALILHEADVTIVNRRKQTALSISGPALQKLIIKSIKKREAMSNELNLQNWDLEISSPSCILEQFIVPDVVPLVCAYANPYNDTTEQPLLRAMKHYIHNNAIHAGMPKSAYPTRSCLTRTRAKIPKPAPAYTLCCAESPDCSCPIKVKKTKNNNNCAIQ